MNQLQKTFGITDYIRYIALNASIIAQNVPLKLDARGTEVTLRKYQSGKEPFLLN